MGENLWFHFEKVDADLTSQESRIWTETSENSKLEDIKRRLSSTTWTKIESLKTLIQKREYKKFQREIGLTSPKDVDGKLWKKSLEYFNNYLKKIKRENSSSYHFSSQLRDLTLGISTPSAPINPDSIDSTNNRFNNITETYDGSKLNSASKQYLSKYETLPPSIYNLIFSWKDQIKQWQLWNCYLISGLIELSNTQYFDTLMRTSVTRVRFNDGAPWFTVKIPLWEPDGRDILIKDSEILMAKLKWNIGYKLLELAYIKNKRPNNRAWNIYSPITNEEIQKTRWWITKDVLQTFLGHHNIWFSDWWTARTWNSWKTLSELSQNKKNEITNYLSSFNWRIWNRFTDLGTPPSKNGDSDSFQIEWNTLYNWHSYALASVEKNADWSINRIHLKNPRNNEQTEWGTDVKLSLNGFFSAFSYMGVWKLKVDTFLDDKWVSYA